ncbi:phosphatase PAP2 family protein [Enterococcus sp. 669A]|uniref:Phosphatase PAP2 family protein n=1 Tax=Candidatus Enterococcus moelleringii TaxID=2815325 RepID=A0ABS3L4Y3_9ENTE|nr:phosphatase PAP2 family protein [Enterococcus sp. 669A]MBO1304677.1 phosphatase PAP2 family protein [Enterococcus sp. 669A]
MIGAAASSFVAFLLVLILVQGQNIQPADVAFSQKVITYRKAGLTKMFLFFTKLGKAVPTLLICLLLVLIPQTRTTIALNVGINVVATTGLTFIIKRIFKRERPRDNRLVEETDHSFPSGHSSTAATLYIGIFLNALLFMNAAWWLAVPAFLLSFLVGFSRVYLGIHYFTDVLGGWFLGLTIAFVVPLLMN